MTTALAIWAAAVSTALAFLRIREYMVNKPRLYVTEHLQHGAEGTSLGVTVVNRPGGQATTIVAAGLLIDRENELEKVAEPWEDIDELRELGVLDNPSKTVTRKGRFAQSLSEDVTVLEPGRSVTFTVEPRTLPVPAAKVDDPIRPYAIDLEGRHVLGEAKPLFRTLMDAGWTPQPDRGPDDPFRQSIFIFEGALQERTWFSRLFSRKGQ
jgi:hypothetical protein